MTSSTTYKQPHKIPELSLLRVSTKIRQARETFPYYRICACLCSKGRAQPSKDLFLTSHRDNKTRIQKSPRQRVSGAEFSWSYRDAKIDTESGNGRYKVRRGTNMAPALPPAVHKTAVVCPARRQSIPFRFDTSFHCGCYSLSLRYLGKSCIYLLLGVSTL